MAISPQTQAQLDTLTPEQLESLKQELIRQRNEEPSPRSDGSLQDPDARKKILLRGLVRGAVAFGEGANLGFHGRPISELELPGPDKPKPEYRPTTQEEALQFERARAGISRTLSPEDAALKKAQAEYYQAGTEQKRNPEEYRPTTQEEALQFERARAGISRTLSPEDAALKKAQAEYYQAGTKQKSNPEKKPLSPYLQKAKDTRAEKFITTIEDNKIKKDQIEKARSSLNRITPGLGGKIQKGFIRNLSPDNPLLTDWQNIRMVLTDAQLLQTAKTKGAISDREMELFAKAAANDEITNPREIIPVLDKLVAFMDAEEKSSATTFQALYNEDPYSLFGENQSGGQPLEDQSQNAAQVNLEGKTATNPTTGEKIIFKNGQWVPYQQR